MRGLCVAVLLAGVAALAGCSTGFGCAEASADGVLIRSCWRNVDACRYHRYASGEVVATAIAIEPISGWLASVAQGIVGAVGGWFVGGPATATAGGVLGAADAALRRDGGDACYQHWPPLVLPPPVIDPPLEPER